MHIYILSVSLLCLLLYGCDAAPKVVDLPTANLVKGVQPPPARTSSEPIWLIPKSEIRTGDPGLIFSHKDYLAILHVDAALVRIFSPSGQFLNEFSFIGTDFPAPTTPRGLVLLKERLGVVDIGEDQLLWFGLNGNFLSNQKFTDTETGADLGLAYSLANGNYATSPDESSLLLPTEASRRVFTDEFYQRKGLVAEIDLKSGKCKRTLGQYPEIYQQTKYLASLRDCHIALNSQSGEILLGFDADHSIWAFAPDGKKVGKLGFSLANLASPEALGPQFENDFPAFLRARDQSFIFSKLHYSPSNNHLYRTILLPAADSAGVVGVPENFRGKILLEYDANYNLIHAYQMPKGFGQIRACPAEDLIQVIGYDFEQKAYYLQDLRLDNPANYMAFLN